VVVSVVVVDQPRARGHPADIEQATDPLEAAIRPGESRRPTWWKQGVDKSRPWEAGCKSLLARDFQASLESFAGPNVWQVYQLVRVSLPLTSMTPRSASGETLERFGCVSPSLPVKPSRASGASGVRFHLDA
jgi:hypothetical protein